jgi:hypothetical protein
MPMTSLEIRGSHGWKRGIRAYSVDVGKCKACNRPNNTFWQGNNKHKAPAFACSQKCANKLSYQGV